jgi:hypothetical protein
MADYFDFVLDSEPAKHMFVPLTDIESIETSNDRRMVIRLRKHGLIFAKFQDNAEEFARTILGGHFEGALVKGRPQIDSVSASEV